MKHLPKMFGAAIAKAVFSFSFVLLLVVLAVAAPNYAQLKAQLDAAHDTKSTLEALTAIRHQVEGDKKLDSAIQVAIATKGSGVPQDSVQNVKDMLDLRIQGSTFAKSPVSGDSQKAVQEIKRSPLYRDAGERSDSNWLDQAWQRLQNLFPTREPKRIRAVSGPNLTGLTVVMWGLLITGVLVFLYVVARQIQFGAKGKAGRKSKAVLDDDEPDRTLDEWLALSNDYAAKGEYRQAVRALYLSCLLKFDQKRVARFIRGETNWEHLARITSSPKLPPGLDFLAPTQAFDRVWYGHHVRGMEDVEQFRSWYDLITRALTEVAA